MATTQGKRLEADRLHVGTMGWSYTFWAGALYPVTLKPKEYLHEYSKHFNSVEIDSTFYRVPSASTVRAWKEQTTEEFLFSAKFPRLITHIKMLRDCEEETERFIFTISELHDKLGPLLLQFPSTFKEKHLPLLRDFLPTLPENRRYAVEIRNQALLGESLYSILKKAGATLVLSDQSYVASIERTAADFAYIRWEGDRSQVTGTSGKVEVDRAEETRTWARAIRRLLDDGMEVFGYFSKYYSGFPPADIEQLLSFLRTA